MRTLKTLTIALALSGLVAGAWAAPSVRGSSGSGVLFPDTEVLPAGTLAVSASALWIERDAKTQDNQWYALSYAPMENLEVGVARAELKSTGVKDWLFQARMLLLPEKGRRPALVVGMTDMTNEMGFDEASAYAAVSAVLWAPTDPFTGEPVNPLRASLGFGTGMYGKSPFAGLNWQVHPRATVSVEYGKDLSLGFGKGVFNLGGQYTVGKSLALNAGVVDMRHAVVGLSFLTDGLF